MARRPSGGLEFMMSVYRRAGGMLESHFRAALEAALARGRAGDGVVVCGMGSSGIAGDVVSVTLEGLGSREPVRVYRAWRLPPWEPGPSVVLGVSYSGTTWETLSCVEGAGGAPLAAVTSGGRLAGLVESRGGLVARLEGGLPQRTALPAMVGGALGLAPLWSSVGRAALEAEVSLAAAALRAGEPGWLAEVAGLIAASDLVVVAGCGFAGPAAHRWRTELAENAKIPAKAEVYPESGHNDLVAYQVKPGARVLFIILEGGEPPCSELLGVVGEIYEGVGTVFRVRLPGEGRLAAVMRGAQLAGMASAMAAAERGVDPLETPILERYRSWRARGG